MTRTDLFLFCFVVGLVWSLLSLLLGSFHAHGHVGHVHSHGLHGQALHAHGVHGHAHSGHAAGPHPAPASRFFHHLLDLNSLAIFLAWFGGCGYLLLRHSTLAAWTAIVISASAGLGGAVAMASFLRFLHSKERVMEPVDYDMVGVLGRVSSTIRASGTGEILFSRHGARCLAYARSEDGETLELGAEVIVTRYDAGVAYVRAWDAMTGFGNEIASGREEAPPAFT
jgi:membrane protein implicated in regulation of membrane protease activity